MEKWYDDDTSYSRILENPYIISEESELNDSRYVTTEMVDLGVIPDSEIQGDWLPEHPSRIDTRIDERRIRSSITFKLKWQLSEGDTLLSITEITDYLEESLNVYDVKLPKNYIANKRNFMEETLAFVDGVSDPEANACDSALQLKEYFEIEKFLRSKFKARAAKSVKNPIKENWESIVKVQSMALTKTIHEVLPLSKIGLRLLKCSATRDCLYSPVLPVLVKRLS